MLEGEKEKSSLANLKNQPHSSNAPMGAVEGPTREIAAETLRIGTTTLIALALCKARPEYRTVQPRPELPGCSVERREAPEG